MSKQWFWLLAERLDAVAVLYRVAAMVADADPRQDTIRVDHYRRGPYDLLITPASSTGQALSGGRTVGLIRQGPMLPGSNLRYRLRSIGHLPRNERPFLTLVLTHADQATRRVIRALGDPTEHRRTFVATEGEPLAGDHAGVVWQQCGSGLGQDPPVLVTPETSLSGILPWAEVLGLQVRTRRRIARHPAVGGSTAGVVPPVAARQPHAGSRRALPLHLPLQRAGRHAGARQAAGSVPVHPTDPREKNALDLLGAWPRCNREQLAGLMGALPFAGSTRCCAPCVNGTWCRRTAAGSCSPTRV